MNELVVSFTNGTNYKLTGVTQEIFEELKAAPSVGSFFNSRLKGKYQAEKIS